MVGRTSANRRSGNKHSIEKNQTRRKRRKLAYSNRKLDQTMKAVTVENTHLREYLQNQSSSPHIKVITAPRIERSRRVRKPMHLREKELTDQEKLDIIDDLYGSMDEYTSEGVLETFRISSREDWEEETN